MHPFNTIFQPVGKSTETLGQDHAGWTPLQIAIDQRQWDQLPALLAKKVGINLQRYPDGRTPLHDAVLSDSSQAVELLVDHGADTDIQDHDGKTTLHLAIQEKLSSEIISCLIRHTKNLNSQSVEGSTALHVAIQQNLRSAIDALLEKGADSKICDNNGYTALLLACKYKLSTVAEDLIKRGPETVNAVSNDGLTALHFAVCGNLYGVVRALVKLQAGINTQDGHGLSPLHLAVENRLPSIVNILLDGGADYNIRDQNGYTPLGFAIKDDLVRIMEVLVYHWADYEVQSGSSLNSCRTIMLQELVGCYCVEENRITTALEFWHKAHDTRLQHGIPVPLLQTSRIFDDNQKIATLQELESPSRDHNKICRQSLQILERILGAYSLRTTSCVVRRGEELCKEGDYKQGIPLCITGLNLCHERHLQKGRSIIDDRCLEALTACATALWDMKRQNTAQPVTYSTLLDILQRAFGEARVVNNLPASARVGGEDPANCLMSLVLHVIRLVIEFGPDAKQRDELQSSVNDFMEATNIVDTDGQTFLDLAKSPASSKVRGKELSKFPCDSVITLLTKKSVPAPLAKEPVKISSTKGSSKKSSLCTIL